MKGRCAKARKKGKGKNKAWADDEENIHADWRSQMTWMCITFLVYSLADSAFSI
jgi:hypothetical protein